MRMRMMPDGKTLAEELHRAMKRIEGFGVRYPLGYYDTITQRYTLENVPYPYIVMQIGEARIRKHFLYSELFGKGGDLLDYGCGTGDAIRQLIRDGYPVSRITGFDVSDASLRIGYDLYLDRDEIEPLVSVAPSFPCPHERFDRVYSGSVIHVLGDERDFLEYLEKAHRTLRKGGVFFGSTLGLDDAAPGRGRDGPPRLMRKRELVESFEKTGFSEIQILQEERPELELRGLNFCLYQFCAKKGK
ncbi:MAG: class I SAM-dependent methyltransferase [Methanoregula sp.]|nr:class I SAM-dependent methyltransferase [Methanoregula sp.]